VPPINPCAALARNPVRERIHSALDGRRREGLEVNESYSRWWVLLTFGVLLLALVFVVHVSK
jgi:hypothetical protein